MMSPSGPKTTRATPITANERRVRLTGLSFQCFLPLFHEFQALVLFETGENIRVHLDGFQCLAQILGEAGGGDRSWHVAANRIDQGFLGHHSLAAFGKNVVEK